MSQSPWPYSDAPDVIWSGDTCSSEPSRSLWQADLTTPFVGRHVPAPLRSVRTAEERSARLTRFRPVAEARPVRSVIVDDSGGFIDRVSPLLAPDGFEMVGTARNHERGLRLVSDLRPDLAFIDLDLGSDSGLELVADIAAFGLAERVFLILISAYAAEDLHELFDCSDADGYLSKLDMCGDAVREVLRGTWHGVADRPF